LKVVQAGDVLCLHVPRYEYTAKRWPYINHSEAKLDFNTKILMA
jgi:hypothetical protein